MNKQIILGLFIFTLNSCAELGVNSSAQKKTIKKKTEYLINIEGDSTQQSYGDTLGGKIQFYDRNGRTLRFVDFFQGDTTMKITYKYDSSGKLLKSTLKLSELGKVVEQNFNYNSANVATASGQFEFYGRAFIFKSKTEYFSEKVTKRSVEESILIIDQLTNDTIQNDLNISRYNIQEQMVEMEYVNLIDPEKNRSRKFIYNGDFPEKSIEFYTKDSLSKTVFYKYIFDNNGSWLERRTISNDTLRQLSHNEIVYY